MQSRRGVLLSSLNQYYNDNFYQRPYTVTVKNDKSLKTLETKNRVKNKSTCQMHAKNKSNSQMHAKNKSTCQMHAKNKSTSIDAC